MISRTFGRVVSKHSANWIGYQQKIWLRIQKNDTCLQGFLAFRILQCTNCMVFFFFVFFWNGIASVSLSQLMESFALKTRQLWMEKWTDCKWETLSVGNRFSQIGYLCKKSETSDEKVLIIEFFTTDGNISGKCFLIEMFAKIHKIYFFTIILGMG